MALRTQRKQREQVSRSTVEVFILEYDLDGAKELLAQLEASEAKEPAAPGAPLTARTMRNLLGADAPPEVVVEGVRR